MVCLKVSKPHVLRWQKRWKIPSCYTLNHFAQQLVCGIRIHVSVCNSSWMNSELWIEFTTQISIFTFSEMKTKADCFPSRCCCCCCCFLCIDQKKKHEFYFCTVFKFDVKNVKCRKWQIKETMSGFYMPIYIL